MAARGEGQVIKNEIVARNVSEVLGIHVPHLLEISFGEGRWGEGKRGEGSRGEGRGKRREEELTVELVVTTPARVHYCIIC